MTDTERTNAARYVWLREGYNLERVLILLYQEAPEKRKDPYPDRLNRGIGKLMKEDAKDELE